MEFLGHVWTVKEVVIVILVPCIFVMLHYASEWLCKVDEERAKRNGH